MTQCSGASLKEQQSLDSCRMTIKVGQENKSRLAAMRMKERHETQDILALVFFIVCFDMSYAALPSFDRKRAT